MSQMPPHDVHAEDLVVSQLLNSPKTLDVLEGRLSHEDFYSGSNARIFRAAETLHARGDTVTLENIVGVLTAEKRLAEVGGRDRLLELSRAFAIEGPRSLKRRTEDIFEAARKRRLLLAMQEACSRLYTAPDSAFDVWDVVQAAASQILASEGHSERFTMLEAHKAKGRDWQESAKRPPCRPTGIHRLDRNLRSIAAGRLTVIGGRPGDGKSSLALQIADATATKGMAVVVFSLEMPASEIAGRHGCMNAAIPVGVGDTGRMSPEQWSRYTAEASRSAALPIVIYQMSAPTMDAIRTKIRQEVIDARKQRGEFGCAIIDYLQLMRMPKADRHDLAVGMVTSQLKALAMELQIPIVLLSQLSRDSAKGDRPPRLSDLRDSGSIEQDADAVVFVYPKDDEIIIAKQRNGPMGEVPAIFQREFARFIDDARKQD